MNTTSCDNDTFAQVRAYSTHHDYYINVEGTSFKDYINATFKQLVALFGEPWVVDGSKTNFEWHIQLATGPVLTIYNWKTTGSPYEITRWHVGAKDVDAVCVLDAIINKGPQ